MNENVPTITLRDGNTMPQLGLGTYQSESGEETENAVKVAIQDGYRLIDTAALYMNESDVGKAIASSNIPREELFITTKLWNSDQGAENVRPALEKSLEKLGLDYVDLYLIHWPTPERDLYVETWKEFMKLRDEGLIKSIGVSNFQVEHLERLKAETGEMPVLNQIELHPGFSQKELRDYGQANTIITESWRPIGGSRGRLLEDETIKELAERYGKTPAQVVLRWHIQHGLVVIPKSVHDTRIKENIDVFDFELDAADMAVLDDMNGEREGPNPDTMNNS